MTEHKKIPLPGEGGPGESKESSLLERASGAFGFDSFKPAAMPGKLSERPMKRAKKVTRKGAEAPVAEPVAQAHIATEVEPAANLPVPAAAPAVPAVVEGAPLAPVFDGARHPVDRAHLRDQGMIDPDGPVSELLEEFRIVKRQLLGTAREKGTAKSRRILVSSPHQDEGKTFCASNLAIAMAAERDTEVLLVDADVANPSILSTFGLPKGSGFMDAMANPDVPVEDLVMGTDIPNLWVLPAGLNTNSASELLSSGATAEVLDRLTVGVPGRIVIFDTPPALAASPAAELAKHVGQVMLVARADKTGRSAMEDACQLLSACDDIKLLLNAANFSPSGRRFGSYYG
ncbi:AAA family ATPase [Parerythrobacter jejuensis]|uniref:AAA family ATPase n=1 Tax=Parerythrobacter jejuensis TaxID=795812 RepID=A0A845AT11_9SPHN|nr:AAA family ATPase [Parerythrobacter jejuensis]MXP32497.1 AAA family ATPase [Parerythrobacter jejuensis]